MNIERDNLLGLRVELNAAIKAVCDKHGLTFEIGAITYEPGSNFRFRTTIRQSNVGRVGAPWASNRLEVKPGDVIIHNGKTFKYVGPRSGRKYRHLVELAGKRYKMSDSQIRSGLQPEGAK